MRSENRATRFLRLPDGALINRDFSITFDMDTYSVDGLKQRHRRRNTGTVTWIVGGITWAARYDAITEGTDNIITPTYTEMPS